MTACMGLCEAFAAGVRKQSLTPMQAPVGLFLRGVWKGGVFRVSVGHPGLGGTKIPCTNPLHLTSSMTRFKSRILRKTGVTHGVENEAG